MRIVRVFFFLFPFVGDSFYCHAAKLIYFFYPQLKVRLVLLDVIQTLALVKIPFPHANHVRTEDLRMRSVCQPTVVNIADLEKKGVELLK